MEYGNLRISRKKKVRKKPTEHGHQLLIDYINKEISANSLSQDNNPLICLEIGTTREKMPGQDSTRKIARCCHDKGINFITVDMDSENTEKASKELKEINQDFQAITKKGEDFLQEYEGSIDFVYLDAYDFDHGKHSRERQKKYVKYLGKEINDIDCHKMHLDCAKLLVEKISLNGVIFLDDTWKSDNKWCGKGTTAVPFLVNNGYELTTTAKDCVLLKKI